MIALLRALVAMMGVTVAPLGWAALGTSAAADPQGRVWIAYAQAHGDASVVHVSQFDDTTQTWRHVVKVNHTPEPVSADGENRPKLAFGPAGEMYVSWTSPTSAKYTGDIRFARSLDRGKTWSEPVTVHRDRQRISHRFESLLVDQSGRIWIAWIDKRDLHAAQGKQRPYAGAAIYYAVSTDRGTTWQGDFKVADNSCECCRIAMTLDSGGAPTLMWRHVFEPNERDHAIVTLTPEGPSALRRVTFDRWTIDACPHHGPSLAIEPDGTRHAVWFNQVQNAGRVYYGQLGNERASHLRTLPAGASHADVLANGATVALAWKRFDGKDTLVETLLSDDGGESFRAGPVLATTRSSDQPRLISRGKGAVLVWRQEDRTSVVALDKPPEDSSKLKPAGPTVPTRPISQITPFEPDTMKAIEREHQGRAFWVLLWDLECTYCMKSMQHAVEAQQRHPNLTVVTIATDPATKATELRERLAELGLQSSAFAFGGASTEALRYAIDPLWTGEKPRSYRYSASGQREAISGVLSVEQLISP
jgi:hypothetical protein